MVEREITALVRALQRLQAERYYGVKGLAQKLGFSVGYLSMVLRGQRRPGLRFMRAVAQHFPELRPQVWRALGAGDGAADGEGSAADEQAGG